MKISTIYKKLLVLPLALVLGCSDFLDVNDSPNNPLKVPPQTLLPTGLAGSAFANANELNRFASTAMSYLAGAAGSPQNYDTYVLTGGDFGNQWNGELYNGSLITYKKMIEAADEVGAKAYSGIGKIMMAYTFALATDTWGDIPYSEALQGDKGIVQPRLDSQEDIYKGNSALGIVSLFDLVREGLADLDLATTLTPGTDDLVYGAGGIANWRRAGNSLLLKLAMQISRKEPALATTVVNEVIQSNNYIVANNQNLAVKFGSAVGSQSPIFTYTYVSLFINDLIASTRFVNRLTALNDPRLPIYITRPSGAYVTIDNGFRGTLPTPNTNWSRWSTTVVGTNGVGPVRLITNAQVAFMLAEAVVSLGVTVPGKTAEALYQDGITASMQEAAVPAAAITAYLAANGTLTGTPTQQVEQIITQKYIALIGNGLEAWNDWRRTGFPVLPDHQNAAGIDGTRPVRAMYLNSEISRNPNFAPVRNTNERVWWDVD